MRLIAYKVSLEDISNGEYVRTESQWDPNYLITPTGRKVSRVRVLGTVVDMHDDEDFRRFTIDDGEAEVDIVIFGDVDGDGRDIEIGTVVDVIGRVKESEGNIYISAEIIKRIDDPNWEILREAELLFLDENDPKKKVLNIILKNEDGVEYQEIVAGTGLPEDEVDEILNMLLVDEGKIYEPRPGFFKKVG